jgi:ribonucleotide monophosphatase NagD (HAD superfamily)
VTTQVSRLVLLWSEASANHTTESDIAGGNSYKSAFGSKWSSILLRTGVYAGGEPTHKPTVIVDDVYDAVQWAIEDAKN